jgi:hypothetical protein
MEKLRTVETLVGKDLLASSKNSTPLKNEVVEQMACDSNEVRELSENNAILFLR